MPCADPLCHENLGSQCPSAFTIYKSIYRALLRIFKIVPQETPRHTLHRLQPACSLLVLLHAVLADTQILTSQSSGSI